MLVRLANKIQSDSIVDGTGLRMIVWFQGCLHMCPFCHNANTHDMLGGFETDTEKVKEEIKELAYHDGITLSGGDPLFQVDAALDIVKYCKELGLNVWVYTGFTYEQIVDNPKYRKLLMNIDVLVDGRYMDELKSLNILYRGSTNQRLIDVPKSLKQKEIVLLELKKVKEEAKEKLFV